jgi:hypothetical protein
MLISNTKTTESIKHCQTWWYTPLEDESGGSQVQGQPGLHNETLSQKKYKTYNKVYNKIQNSLML